MSSSYSSTTTSTYTVADVEKVVRSIKADLIMIAGSTRAMTVDMAEEYAHDIELLAKNNYLAKVDVTLVSALGSEINAAIYEFQNEDAFGTGRPGGVMWPFTPGGSIRVILSYTDKYRMEKEKANKLFLKLNWQPSYVDTSHSHLTSSGSRGYSSNGFGVDRSDFS